MINIDPNMYACATCQVPLNIHEINGVHRFEHARPPADGHLPNPVPADWLPHLAMVCDFCSAPDPLWSYRFGRLDIIMPLPTGDVFSGRNFGDRWAACSACANLIDLGNQRELTRRAHRKAQRRGHFGAFPELEQIHQALFALGVPAREPLYPTAPAAQPAAEPQTVEAPTIRPTILPKVRDRLADYWRHRATQHFAAALSPERIRNLAAMLARDADTQHEQGSPIEQHAALMAHHAHHAALYWIDPEFTELARFAAASLPDVQISPHEPPTTEGLLIWSTPICHAHVPAANRTIPIVAAQWGRIPRGLWLTFFTTAEATTDRSPTPKELQQLREQIGWLAPISTGTAITFDQAYTAATADTGAMIATLITTWILAAQPDTETDDVEPDKAIRRAYARAQRPAPLVRVLRLRRKNPTTTDATADNDATTRVYRHRWWVNGFWRQQPYGPERALRRRTYVRGHMKGPNGAPLLLTRTVRVLGDPHAEPPTPDDPSDPAI